jgi:hypothetical protein
VIVASIPEGRHRHRGVGFRLWPGGQGQYPGLAVADETQNHETQDPGWRGAIARLSPTFLRPPKPRPAGDASEEPPARMSDNEKRRAILNLDTLERKVGLIGSALAALIALATQLPYVLKPSTPVSQSLAATKAHTCTNKAFIYDKATNKCNGKVVYSLEHWLVALILLLVFALAMYVTVRIGRRGPVGFTALMAGFAFETEVGILGLPFIAAGGWLLIRAWRVQKYGSPTATKVNPTGEKRAPPPRAQRAPRSKKSKGPQRTGPAPNKRYTPKSPSRKKKAPVTPPPGS